MSISHENGFVDHDLDYDRIKNAGLGRLSETNSSFREEGGVEKINPLGRWKQRLSPENVAAIEAAVGDCLEEIGYTLSLPKEQRTPGMREWATRNLYRTLLEFKTWVKLNGPTGRMVDLTALELEDEPAALAHSAR